jgi:hypothetical protein
MLTTSQPTAMICTMTQVSPRLGRLIPNPFVKKRNLDWSPELQLSIKRLRSESPESPPVDESSPPAPSPFRQAQSAIDIQIAALQSFAPLPPAPCLRLSVHHRLLTSALGNPNGAHFVIHLHDHPVAGPHYDLRLQINPTSSASWAIMKGLPGDPNSITLNRNATETRVHTLESHATEGASRDGGALLVWDVGTYKILERRSKHAPAQGSSEEDEDGDSNDNGSSSKQKAPPTEQRRLAAAFANRKIRLRLDGARLPRPYVVNLRLTKAEDASGRAKSRWSADRASASKAMPRRTRAGRATRAPTPGSSFESRGGEGEDTSPCPDSQTEAVLGLEGAQQDGVEVEEEIRRTNAYPGASNTIGSVHQRRWYLSLDRAASGFVARSHKALQANRSKTVWDPVDGKSVSNADIDDGREHRMSWPFYARGPEHDRSLITDRLAADVFRNDNVEGFVRRKGWEPVLK